MPRSSAVEESLTSSKPVSTKMIEDLDPYQGPANTRGGIPSCFQAFEFEPSDKSFLSEGKCVRSGDDEMVENFHIDHGEGLSQALRE